MSVATEEPRRPLVSVAVACIALVLASVGVGALVERDPRVPDSGALLTVSGRSEVTRANGATSSVATGGVLRAGDEVTALDGTFFLELPGGARLDGREGNEDFAGTSVRIGDVPVLVAGEALLQGPSGTRLASAESTFVLEASGGGIGEGDRRPQPARSPTPDGALRLQRDLAVTASVYRGAVTIRSGGQDRRIGGYRSLVVPSLGRLDGAAVPLSVNPNEPWDQQMLGEEIDADARLTTLSLAISRAGAGRVGLVPTDLIDGLDDEAADVLRADPILSGFSDGDRVVLVAMVELLTGDSSIDPLATLSAMVAFRNEGANWGLVASDSGVSIPALLDKVEEALRRLTLPAQASGPDVENPNGSASTSVPPTTSRGPSTAPATSPSTVPAGTVTVPPTSTTVRTTVPTVPPVTLPQPPQTVPPLIDLGSTVEQLGELLGGLLNG